MVANRTFEMFPNSRVEHFYKQCEFFLGFSGVSWWLIDLEDNPDTFYCNKTMCDTFHLENDKVMHSVTETCPIAGDYNKFIALKSTNKARKVLQDYSDLRANKCSEYNNRFPYYDEVTEKVNYFTSRAKALCRNEQGEAVILLGIIEPEVTSEILYKQATVDGLTGLKNRREFDNQLAFLLNLARREQRYISLIMADIDCFKLYNDSAGHYDGDECLRTIARAFFNVCNRETDIICRYGGEEFAVITYGEKGGVEKLAENIVEEIANLGINHPAPKYDTVTISAGFISIIPELSTTTKSLIEMADAALYTAKKNGKNQAVDYHKLGARCNKLGT